jgi:pimeloyl-ACP methyl ester carboxylesterase
VRPRAAAFEPRLAVLIADPGQYDFASRMRSILPGDEFAKTGDQFQKLLDADPEVDEKLQGLLDGPRNIEWYGSRMATLGATTVGAFIRRQLEFNLEGLVANIQCPTLLTEGEGDFASQSQVLYDQLPVEKELKKFSEAEGAGGHCEGLGATLFEGYAFDWLDNVLARAK